MAQYQHINNFWKDNYQRVSSVCVYNLRFDKMGYQL